MKKPLLLAMTGLTVAATAFIVRSQSAEKGLATPYRLTVVKTIHPPKVDGDMNQTDWIGPEWGAVAAINGFTDVSSHKYSPRQTRAYLTYDNERLYFAFSCDIEAGTRPAANVTQQDGPLWSDDSIEFLIAPPGADNGAKPVPFQFIGNSAGAYYDAKGLDKAWNGKWKYAAKAYGDYWIAEGSIAWADLGAAAPRDGETWRFNFCRDLQNPARPTVWGPSTDFQDVSKFPVVTFRDKGTVALVENLGKFTSGNVKFGVNLANIGGVAADDVTGTLSLGSATTEATATVPAGGKSRLEFATAVPDKNTDSLSLRIASKTSGQTLWEGGLDFDKTDPVVVALQPVPRKKLVEIKVDVAGIAGRPAGTTAKVVFMGDNATKKVAEVDCTPFDEKGQSFTELPLAKLPAGDYVVLTTIYAGTTKLNESRSHFHRIDESWLGNKVGITDAILPGWIPITVNAKTMKMWGRDVSFDGTIFPSKIISRGASMLASPIRLEGRIDGQPIHWDNVSFKITKKTQARVDFVTTATSGKLKVVNEAYLEYDGMFFFKMHLQPLAPKVKVDSLKLVIPFAPGRAIFLNKAPGEGKDQEFGGIRIPAGKGPVWQRPFANYMWVGDYDRGLQWFAEDSAQWSIPDNKNILEIARRDNSVEWGITMAESAIELSDTRTLAFGLHPTPVKPQPSGSRMLNMNAHQGHSPAVVWTDPNTTKYFGYPEAPDTAYIKRKTDNFHAYGMRPIPYMCPVRIGETSPEWQYFGRDWAMPGVLNDYDVDVLEFSGGQMGACPSIPAFRDWMAWKNKRYLDETGYNGLYYDFAWPCVCYNPNHGHAVGALPLLGYREMYRRLYTIIKQRDPKDLVVAHISAGIFMPMLSWTDTTVPGEEIVVPMANARQQPATKDTHDMADVIDLDYYAAFNMGRQFGPVTNYMQPIWAEPVHNGNFTLLTDTVGQWRTDPQLIQLYQDLGMGADDVRFLPFWSNGKIVQSKFTEAPAGLKDEKYPNPITSVYQRPGKFVLFAVTNWTKAARKVTVSYDPAALKTDLKGYALTDALARAPLFAAKASFDVEIPARSFRVVLLKTLAKTEKALPLNTSIPSGNLQLIIGPGRLVGDNSDMLYVGDATRDEKAPLPQESRLAQSFTLKKTTKIEKIDVEMSELAGGRQGNFCEGRIYYADENGAPLKPVGPDVWACYFSYAGSQDYKEFIFRNSVVLPPGRYAFVLSKMPALPAERHHFRFQKWPQAYLPTETASVWTSVTKRWEKANCIISFGVYGYER